MTPAAPARERWTGPEAYERFMGRWSAAVAVEFVRWLALPAGGRWLDVGSGIGSLAQAARAGGAAAVAGAERSRPYAALARAAGVEVCVADAQALPLRAERFDAAVSGLVLNFVPDPGLMVSEMARVARPGGVVAAYVWDYAVRMQMLRLFWDAAVALDPAAQALDEGVRFPLCHRPALVDLFEAAGLREVAAEAIDVPTPFASFDDYWGPFLYGQGPAGAYCVSLDDARRDALRDELRRRVPAAADGRVGLTARAWAVRGTRGA